jgi:glutathione synthase/RimK-type ligase-like ATP-grasp enzyme
MLLIITHKNDFTADFVISKLNKKQIKYKRFNCEDILSYDCLVQIDTNFSYSILEEKSISSVWFRRTQLPSIKELSLNDKMYLINDADCLIKNLFSIIDAKWMSNPFSVYKAENKLFQLKIAKELGFEVPMTLITNDKKQLKSFYNKQNGKIIIKPISQTRIDNNGNPSFIFTNKITQKHIDSLNDFDLTPCIFQKEIEKEYEIRVTVVGSTLFAASIDSQSDEETKIDWRKKKLVFRAIEIPKPIEKLCIEIVKKLNLSFGAIDLIKDKEGKYIFLEINPNGQWAWIETQTGLNISDAIIKELTNN